MIRIVTYAGATLPHPQNFFLSKNSVPPSKKIVAGYVAVSTQRYTSYAFVYFS